MPNVSREQIVAAARGWLRTAYLHQGRLKGRGIDCVGLPIMVAHDLGLRARDGHLVEPDEYPDYPQEPADGRVLAICRELMIETKTARPGDVICFRGPRSLVPCHLAIATNLPGSPKRPLESLGMIHVNRWVGRVVEHRLNGRWRERIAANFRFSEIS